MKIGVISLGCAKNLVDTEFLLGLLKENQQELVQDYADAEAIIINTCGFIADAKKEAIDTILEAAEYKKHGLKKLVVMGCLAKRYKKELIEEMPEVDCFISLDEYHRLGSILSEVLEISITNTYGKSPRQLSGKPWMAYLKIADGCDNRCSYCAIPSIRGPLVSRKQEEIIEEAKELIKSGVKELNLVAQDCSRYGFDIDGKLHLTSLLKELDALNGVRWIRVLYLYPDEIPDDLIEMMAQAKHVLPYFDIPVQHGSDCILHAMNRRGNQQLIIERAKAIRKALPNAILRTTLITGFPGEKEEDHQESVKMIQEVEFDHLGAFTYSKEENTAAFDLDDDVSEEDKLARKNEILQIQETISASRLEKRIGQIDEVLIEDKDPLTNMYIGRSAIYAPDGIDGGVYLSSSKQIPFGSFIQVRYKAVFGHHLIAERIDD